MNTKMFEPSESIRRSGIAGSIVARTAADYFLRQGRFAAWAALAALLSCALMSTGCGGANAGTPPQAPRLSLGQTSLSFPDTDVGTTSNETAIVTLSSVGNASLHISNITESDATDFPSTTTCPNPGDLAPGSSCTISIQFTPATSGALSGQITISSNAGTGTISLSGNGVGTSACLISPLGGGDAGFTAGTSTFIVFQNAGQVPVSILDIGLSGDFSLFDGTGGPWPTCPAAPFSLSVGQSCNVYVKFNPVGSGNFTGALNATTNCSSQSLITYMFSGSN